MKTYTARCEWDETGWWAVSVPEVRGALTQCRRLDQVEGHLAEVFQLTTGEDRTRYRLNYDIRFPGRPGKLARHARELRKHLDALDQEAQTATAVAARELRDAGVNYRDIGSMLNISHQRAHQVVKGAAGAGSRP